MTDKISFDCLPETLINKNIINYRITNNISSNMDVIMIRNLKDFTAELLPPCLVVTRDLTVVVDNVVAATVVVF